MLDNTRQHAEEKLAQDILQGLIEDITKITRQEKTGTSLVRLVPVSPDDFTPSKKGPVVPKVGGGAGADGPMVPEVGGGAGEWGLGRPCKILEAAIPGTPGGPRGPRGGLPALLIVL